jgi:hypothetical protein
MMMIWAVVGVTNWLCANILEDTDRMLHGATTQKATDYSNFI